ncbi:tRNA (adenosine(37)-N6)-threonylcarbamoyltransferase complex ATPase subunit type 1 TsaE [Paenibacillus sp. IB182496]|uniref:tRNA threonylcarbamoyladenosine biosynthesis protein TsaE n=1 Tax=Paenibacillus sabuli TaxID=2772509 RepID=A0A927BUN1_9BACL|nr:tRNA (adenosine(37)-N6)-threonylcarbamoyltransferase complex ATPase subunit type 1 TsaE [Paenibacillus sabuli]MBD2847151.1 tRNA (adenosine(37)-N6)-threonylcarbamoyltransferase complex ATPase subunit type 1 TsaE [Paenibacillus sabuli]
MTTATTRYEIGSEADTVRLAQRLAALADAGSVLALDGELGAGKTRFSQALAAALGVTELVNSPTFTIIKEYEGATLPFYHMDVYRISTAEADELGLDDYFYGSGVTVVEWASRIEPLLPPERLELRIAHAGDDRRSIRLTGIGAPYAGWIETLRQGGGAEQ